MNENPIETPIDFTALDPTRDRERFEQIVRSITVQAAEVLIVRPLRRLGVMEQIAAWRTPTLAAAAVVAAASILTFAWVGPAQPATVARTPQIAEAVGVPATVAQWMRSGELPTAGDLLVTFDGREVEGAVGGGGERE
jgi:hypothetical protein